MISAPPSLLADQGTTALALGGQRAQNAKVDQRLSPLLLAIVLVTLPVFVQAPLVHAQPLVATLLTAPLLGAGIVLGLSPHQDRAQLGAVLVGFAGSWLCGSLFWGWLRLHPLLHLPVEALALPLAVAGLASRWRLAGAFYLASLLGTAATDAAMALTGLMPLWPAALAAEPTAARALLQDAALQVLTPLHGGIVLAFAAALLGLGLGLRRRGGLTASLAAATLITTLAVDAAFLLLALMAPRFSGLI